MQHVNKVAIIFNGPPGSGKDLICDYLAGEEFVNFSVINATHLRFKDKLFELVQCIYGLSEKEFFEIYNDRELKETPLDVFYGRTPRGAMIHVSEDLIKPNFGKDYFGRAAAKAMKPGINCFSDAGFPEELEPIYNETEGQMLIVQVHRDGCDFSNDSRNYINQFKDVKILKLYNNSSIEELKTNVLKILANEFEQTITYRHDIMDYTVKTKLKGS